MGNTKENPEALKKEIEEIFEMREALEGMSAKLFCERASEKEKKELADLMEKQMEAYKKDSYEEFMKIDMQFHLLLAKGAKNARIQNALASVFDQVTAMSLSSKEDIVLRGMARDSHERLYEAIQEGDKEKAWQEMTAHMIEVKKYHMDKCGLL